jgi:NCAIR mutase (PurE)-related protein
VFKLTQSDTLPPAADRVTRRSRKDLQGLSRGWPSTPGRRVTDHRIEELLRSVAEGQSSPTVAAASLDALLVEQIDGASVDHARPLLQGFPEVVFGAGKTPGQIVEICRSLVAARGGFLVTRLPEDAIPEVREAFPEVELDPVGGTAHLPMTETTPLSGSLLVVSAGTSDESVAREAAVTAQACGAQVERLVDVGVAGIHRLLRKSTKLREADVIIVVAGMDGALPSVVGGLVSVPVIAVPTSVGYGAAFSGVSALLAMLNSCASGVTVVNIDGGFTAGMAAVRILRQLV